MKRVAVLGSTGSIGRQALEIVACAGGRLAVSALCAKGGGSLLEEQARRFGVKLVIDAEQDGRPPRFRGMEALEEAVACSDLVLNAISGSAGLRASVICARTGRPLALANKESLVIGGELLKEHIAAGLVIPVDSEHSTVWRCLSGERVKPAGIVLTASGGAARGMTPEQAAGAGPETVLQHPTWRMGPRITVDSATLVNKAFEVIEAKWLFPGIPVSAVLHPQSIVHSLVRLADGSMKALLGSPDMRLPIQYALLGGESEPAFTSADSLLDWPPLTFSSIPADLYPAFGMVCRAGEAGMTSPAAANAADEVAVDAFLEGRIRLGGIAEVIGAVLERFEPFPADSFEAVMEADSSARALACSVLEAME